LAEAGRQLQNAFVAQQSHHRIEIFVKSAATITGSNVIAYLQLESERQIVLYIAAQLLSNLGARQCGDAWTAKQETHQLVR
jgi:hypothetical protein